MYSQKHLDAVIWEGMWWYYFMIFHHFTIFNFHSTNKHTACKGISHCNVRYHLCIIWITISWGFSLVKVELNLFKHNLVSKIKLTLPFVQNICRIGQLKIEGNILSLIDRCQILLPIQQSPMQQCTGVIFQSSSVPVPVAPTKWLALMHFSIL